MWAAARVCQVSYKPIFRTAVPVLKNQITVKSFDIINATSAARNQTIRQLTYQRPRRVSVGLKKKAIQVEPESAFTVGKGVVAGAGALGLCALCYYGLGLSKSQGIIESAHLWPQYVKDRIKTTYMYVGGSILISVAAAAATLSSPALLRVFASGNIVPNLMLFAALAGTSIMVQRMEYTPGFGAKQIGWVLFSSLIGGAMAPLSFYGGQIVLRAAWYTAGIVGGLSAVAICAPSDQFLKMGGPLAIGLGLTFASGIGSLFLPPTTLLGAGLASMFMYGGLVVFSGLLLYDSQKIIRMAESLPPDYYGGPKYDPITMSMHLFMDIINIFSRIIFMIGNSNNKR